MTDRQDPNGIIRALDRAIRAAARADLADAEQETQDRIRACGRDGDPIPDFRLRCPFCGGELDVFTPDYGRGCYGSSRDGSLLSEGVDCGGCGAVWAPSGWLFRAPRRDPDAPQEAP